VIPLPKKVTPHTLRRTYASLCFFAGRDPRYVMSQIGHADARLTLQVYARNAWSAAESITSLCGR
jgi:integrase